MKCGRGLTLLSSLIFIHTSCQVIRYVNLKVIQALNVVMDDRLAIILNNGIIPSPLPPESNGDGAEGEGAGPTPPAAIAVAQRQLMTLARIRWV